MFFENDTMKGETAVSFGCKYCNYKAEEEIIPYKCLQNSLKHQCFNEFANIKREVDFSFILNPIINQLRFKGDSLRKI